MMEFGIGNSEYGNWGGWELGNGGSRGGFICHFFTLFYFLLPFVTLRLSPALFFTSVVLPRRL